MATNFTQLNLSAWQFAQNSGYTVNKILAALKANNVKPQPDKKYSLRDLVRSLVGESGLKKQAEDARYEAQIDDAATKKEQLKLIRGETCKTEDVRAFMEDAQTVLVQIVRHSKLSEQEKTLMIRQIGELKKCPDQKP